MMRMDFFQKPLQEISFYTAYMLVIFLLINLFSVIVPLMSLFGFIFFLLRYYQEKYKLIYVFDKDIETTGKLRN